MRIAFRKIDDEKHALEIGREGGRVESVECETRSYLVHDLLHYAVESEAGLEGGFWGLLAAGRTLADMNDRTGKSMAGASPELPAIEQIVGALHPSARGVPAAEIVAGVKRFAEALGAEPTPWITVPFVEGVQERMRRLMGHWRATRVGERMELAWPAGPTKE